MKKTSKLTSILLILTMTFFTLSVFNTSSVIASSNSSKIGTINTIAGTAKSAGYSGDGGPAASAKLGYPKGIAVDAIGNIYIADCDNNAIRKVNASDGKISTIAGTGTVGYSGDGGAATSAQLHRPEGLAVDSAGNIYIADCGNQAIRKVNFNDGKINTIAGTGASGYSGDDDAATNAQLNYPEGVAVDNAGNVYIADSSNNRIRKVNASDGKISTIAGTGVPDYSGDGGAATSAEIWDPWGVAVDNAGNVYIADWQNEIIRKVNASNGIINTIAGTHNTIGYTGDGGAATNAQLHAPSEVTVDNTGNIYIADWGNHVIRKVNSNDGKISTIAGTGNEGYSGDGGAATSAQLDYPYGVALDSVGNIYISDDGNDIVRQIYISDPIVIVKSVAALPNINVANGTIQSALKLPSNVDITLSNSAKESAVIKWDNNSNPSYNGNKAGTYVFTGTITLPPGVTNPDNKKVSVNVVVAPTITVPDAPANIEAGIGNGQATVSFTSPANNGGSAITGYKVYAYKDGVKQANLTVSGASSPIIVKGLTNGTAYTFTVVATNSQGDSSESTASSSVTPATVPNAPTNIRVGIGNGQVTVGFAAPDNNGGNAITGYKVYVYKDGVKQDNLTVSGASSPITVKGLTNGTAYTFTVAAINALGDSAESKASTAVCPSNPNPPVTTSPQTLVQTGYFVDFSVLLAIGISAIAVGVALLTRKRKYI